MKSRFFATALALGLASTAFAQTGKPAPLPPDVAIVPPDAVAFVHVRVADLWNSDAFKEIRDIVMQAGTKALEGFDKRFLPTPSSIERVTAFVLPPGEENKQPQLVVVIGTNRAIDKEAFLKSALPNGVEKKLGTQTYLHDAKADISMHFITDRVFALSDSRGIPALLAHKPGSGPIKDALGLTLSNKVMVVAFNPAIVPPKALKEIPPAFRPLSKATLYTMTLEMKPVPQIEMQLLFPDNKTSEAAHDALKEGAKMALAELQKARKEMLAKVLGDGKVAPLTELAEVGGALFALGAMQQVEDFLNDPPILRKENRVQASFKIPQGANFTVGVGAVGVALLLPAVQKVREAAARAKGSNNLKQITLAMFNYESAMGTYPPAAICDKNGKPLLSWRVAMLPYLEQGALYNQFKLDEPWDSDNNKKLIDKMPAVYLHPNAKPEAGQTNYRAFVGGGAALDLKKGVRIVDFTDGTSNTILVAESAETVTWTKPEDFTYDPKKPLPKLGGLSNGGFSAAFADGSVRFLRETIKETTLRGLITRAGGEVLDSGDY